MAHRQSFKNGAHLKAARALAGLKQVELAKLAELHVNSLKRLERAAFLYGGDFAAGRIGAALLAKGIIAEAWPLAMVRLGIPRHLFADILGLIAGLRPLPDPAVA